MSAADRLLPVASLMSGSRETIGNMVPRELSRNELFRQEERDKFVAQVYAIMIVAIMLTVANIMIILLFISSTMESH